ncbi:hypothetical protein L596_013579 [Steinernema carpocapsae]|uniref:Uncharacterized protein n=1 Tax=Steinernema carpocapsae TaxID=34508 RepID=A0A4U5P0Q8_STECR|nr:hypothetical protein L596_013579 [Steinernema carpocapsae]
MRRCREVSHICLLDSEHHGKESAKRRAEIVHIEKYQRHHGTHQPGHVDVTREVELGIASQPRSPKTTCRWTRQKATPAA